MVLNCKKKKKTVVLHNIFVETLFPFFDEINKNSIYLKYKYKLPENTILPTQTFEWQYIYSIAVFNRK